MSQSLCPARILLLRHIDVTNGSKKKKISDAKLDALDCEKAVIINWNPVDNLYYESRSRQ